MRAVLIGIAVLGLGYVGVIALLWVNQDRLVYFPEPGPVGLPVAVGGPVGRRVTIPTGDGLDLVAWAFDPPPGVSAPRWVLVLHGNAGNIATPGRPEHDRQLHGLGLGVLAPDYRGYGDSEGAPSEAGLYRDARAGYDYLRDSLAVPAERIVIYGHSLGSAVAIQLATTVEAEGLIVEGAFTSVPDRGAELYPLLPVRLLARNQFPSLERIGQVRMPLLVIHGREDETIPIAHGRRLFARAAEPKTFLEVDGAHDDAYEVGAAGYEAGIRKFLASLPGGQGGPVD